MLEQQKIKYQDGDTVLEGHCVSDKTQPGKKPAVLIFHDWSGRNEFAEKKAEELAQLGYIGFAVDMYGSGKIGKTKEEKIALMSPLKENRALLGQRALSAFKAIKNVSGVDHKRIAAIGYCFGGLCALDLARSGTDLQGVVSFHGLLDKPDHLKNESIKSKVLVIHGHDDPMVPPEQVLAFETEMTQQKVDWQVYVYGGTMHAFTNPLANDPGFGTVYKEIAAKRSWLAMKNFLAEVFSE